MLTFINFYVIVLSGECVNNSCRYLFQLSCFFFFRLRLFLIFLKSLRPLNNLCLCDFCSLLWGLILWHRLPEFDLDRIQVGPYFSVLLNHLFYKSVNGFVKDFEGESLVVRDFLGEVECFNVTVVYCLLSIGVCYLIELLD
jgi:hypothetical protein